MGGSSGSQKVNFLPICCILGKLVALVAQSLMSELLSLRQSKGWRDIGFNLCVVPFPNVCVPNFKLEDLCQGCSEWLEGPRFGGLEVWEY